MNTKNFKKWFVTSETKFRSGFTLVELLVVIAIIGILSSVVMASLNNARQKARDARRISDVKQMELALEMYYDSYNKYPSVLTDSLLTEYLSTVPTDPLSGTSYFYAGLGATGGKCTSYHLGAVLEDLNNLVLTSDKDAGAAATVCTNGANASLADFNGKTDDCLTGSDVADPSKCYDIKP